MSEHLAKIIWKSEGEPFIYHEYSRNHIWDFGHGTIVQGSAAPEFFGNDVLVDPEQAFVASLSSCHMLTFLAVACKKGFVVESYEDEARGILDKNEEGKYLMKQVILSPLVVFSTEKIPNEAELDGIHRSAHRSCFIANSVVTEIMINKRISK